MNLLIIIVKKMNIDETNIKIAIKINNIIKKTGYY